MKKALKLIFAISFVLAANLNLAQAEVRDPNDEIYTGSGTTVGGSTGGNPGTGAGEDIKPWVDPDTQPTTGGNVNPWVNPDTQPITGGNVCQGVCVPAGSINCVNIAPGTCSSASDICCQATGTGTGGGTGTTSPYPSGGGIMIPTNTGLPDPSGGILEVLVNFMMWILNVFLILSVIAFIITGIQFVIASATSNSAAAGNAKKNFGYAIMALIVVGSSVIIIRLIDMLLTGTGSGGFGGGSYGGGSGTINIGGGFHIPF